MARPDGVPHLMSTKNGDRGATMTYSDVAADGAVIIINAPNAVTAKLRYLNEPDKYGLQLEMIQAGVPLWTAVLPFTRTKQNREWVLGWLQIVLAPTRDNGETAETFTTALAQEYPGMFAEKKKKNKKKKKKRR
jgi:hypothetical protein